MLRSYLAVLGIVLCLAGTVRSASIEENFARDPVQNGWRVFGESSLFHWNAANQNLEVTWCSTNRNSYFYRPLGTVLAKDDDFGFSFDLRLIDLTSGINPVRSNGFEIAIGLIHVGSASQTNFVRGDQAGPLNLMEMDYFADWSTISSTLVDTNHHWGYGYVFQDLTPNDLFHFEFHYAASNQTLFTQVTRNGEPCGESSAVFGDGFQDFRLDAFSINSYSDEGQADPEWAGSVLAHGIIDNVAISSPEPVVLPLSGQLANEKGQVQFATRTNWFYRLQGTSDLHNWSEVASGRGNGGVLYLSDTNARPVQFYRVLAERP